MSQIYKSIVLTKNTRYLELKIDKSDLSDWPEGRTAHQIRKKIKDQTQTRVINIITSVCLT